MENVARSLPDTSTQEVRTDSEQALREAELLEAIKRDALDAPEAYLEKTTTPGGGE